MRRMQEAIRRGRHVIPPGIVLACIMLVCCPCAFALNPALDAGQYNAVVTTLLGFSQEVAIRVAGGADGATVDMRSTSLSSFTDFGENGQRVEAFLLELDNQVTLMLRNAPAQPAATD